MRPILLGMVNPLSTDPKYALFPAPVGCTGYRVWQMLNEQCGAWRKDYLDAFERRNLLHARVWDARKARASALAFVQEVTDTGRIVVVLGEKPRACLGLEKKLIEPIEAHGCTWRQIPHPSGLCRFYNDPTSRRTVAVLLEELYEMGRRV